MTFPLKKCVGTGCPPDYKFTCDLLLDNRRDNPFHAIEPRLVGEHCHFYLRRDADEDMWMPDRMGALE